MHARCSHSYESAQPRDQDFVTTFECDFDTIAGQIIYARVLPQLATLQYDPSQILEMVVYDTSSDNTTKTTRLTITFGH